MAKLTTRQADQQLFTIAAPLLNGLSRELGYKVVVYWPGMDAPKKPNRTHVFVRVDRTVLDKEPLGLQDDSGFISKAEIRVVIHATESITDHHICARTADRFVDLFGRRRCGRDMVIKSSRWQDTVESYGRKLFNVIISYEYESD